MRYAFALLATLTLSLTAQAAGFRDAREAAREVRAMAERLERRGDPRALFAHIYAITIAATDARLAAGAFRNPVWVERLVTNYANLYRRTLTRELAGQRARLPAGWQLSFALADSRRWTAELDAVYGINVHISRDLVEALYVTPTDFTRPSVRADFLRISDVLAAVMPAIWKVYLRYSRAPHLFPSFEKGVMTGWIRRLRAQAWADAAATRDYSASRKRAVLDALDRACVRDGRRYGILLPL